MYLLRIQSLCNVPLNETCPCMRLDSAYQTAWQLSLTHCFEWHRALCPNAGRIASASACLSHKICERSSLPQQERATPLGPLMEHSVSVKGPWCMACGVHLNRMQKLPSDGGVFCEYEHAAVPLRAEPMPMSACSACIWMR